MVGLWITSWFRYQSQGALLCLLRAASPYARCEEAGRKAEIQSPKRRSTKTRKRSRLRATVAIYKRLTYKVIKMSSASSALGLAFMLATPLHCQAQGTFQFIPVHFDGPP